MSYSRQERIILNVIKKTPRIHHNRLQKESGVPKKTFEKHLKSLIIRGKIRHYDFDGKKHYLIKIRKHGKNGSIPPLTQDAKPEWRITHDLYDSQELFDSMKKSFGKSPDKSDIQWAGFVFEKMVSRMLSVIIHDALSDPKKNQHRRFIIEYKKLIKEFFEIIANTKFTYNKEVDHNRNKKNISSNKTASYDVQPFKITVATAELEPFAEEISRIYSEDQYGGDKRLEDIFTSNIEFQLSSLILDHNKITKLQK